MLPCYLSILSLAFVLSVLQVNYSDAIEISSYARVSRNSDSISIQSDRGNKSNDRITLKVSDIDSTLIDNHQQQIQASEQPTKEREAKQMSDKSSNEKSTGRAIQSNYYFPLTNLLTKPVQSSSYNNEKTGRLIVYPSYTANTANGIDQTRNRYDAMPSTGPIAQRRFQYTPDSIYKFKGAENLQGYQYAQPPPAKDTKLTAPIVVPDSPPKSPPKPEYLPPDMMPSPGPKAPPSAPPTYLPPQMMAQPPAPPTYLPPQMMEQPPAPPTYLPPQMMEQPSPMMMSSGPSGPPMDMMPPTGMDHDHDHHHHHDHDHTALDFAKWQSYPEIIYDFDPHHHHHHDEPPPPPTTTAAPEDPPEEPRVKKYSYYYLGRKLWYIPLYFTLWFCLYVAALIIRSIGRHKVDLPNHFVSRSLHDLSHEETVEKINRLTAFTMQQIEDFKEKYL